jgi:hypothetical protein
MASPSSKTSQFLAHAFIPVLCAIALGFIFYGTDVFNPFHGTSQFVHTPIIASVFYFLLVLGNPRNAYAGLFVLLVLTVLSTHSTTAIFIVRDILYFAAIALAVLVYFKYFKQAAHVNHFYPAIAMAGLYAVAYIVTSEIHLAIVQSSGSNVSQTIPDMAKFSAFYGVVIGFAVGGGITLADMFLGPIESDQAEAD